MTIIKEKGALDADAVKELQGILLEEYGQELTIEQTKNIGSKLLSFYALILPHNTV